MGYLLGTGSVTISCDDCVMQGTETCDDCVVTYLCWSDPGPKLVIDVEEARAVRLLTDAGLAPRLRHARRAS